jgi:predicted nucleic acid-binding protein
LIAVDTSVWIAALRSRDASESPILSALLDAGEVLLPVPVRLELLLGASAHDRIRLRRALSALPVAYPADDTWMMMDRWAAKAAEAGERVGFGDLLIGAIASDQGALVWSLDRDFERMARLRFVSLYEP